MFSCFSSSRKVADISILPREQTVLSSQALAPTSSIVYPNIDPLENHAIRSKFVIHRALSQPTVTSTPPKLHHRARTNSLSKLERVLTTRGDMGNDLSGDPVIALRKAEAVVRLQKNAISELKTTVAILERQVKELQTAK